MGSLNTKNGCTPAFSRRRKTIVAKLEEILPLCERLK